MRQLILIILWAMVASSSIAFTGDSLHYLTLKDTIFLQANSFQEKIFIHEFEESQTLYSLAKFYGLTVDELLSYNIGLTERNVCVGSKINVPIPNIAILRYKDKQFKPREYIPVFYVVRKGDTIFRIAKILFRMEVEELMVRNGLETQVISVGQLLHVGWMNIKGIPESYRQQPGGVVAKRNVALRNVYLQESGSRKEYQDQGVAFWKTDEEKESDFYALHDFASLNSVIAVTNPMSRRTVFAKVIGRIPVTTYDANVKVVLSPLAAKFLGAKDPRFFVQLKYLK